MFTEEYAALARAAQKKHALLQTNPLGYLAASALAGLFVGLAIMLIYTIGGLLAGAPATKIVMGASFGVSLSLVIICGAELFTGNNLVMAAGLARHTVSLKQLLQVWLWCYLGNWVGSILLALLFCGAGLAQGQVGEFIGKVAQAKMSLPPLQLLLRGVLCNALVCLATWSSYRCKSESGKLIMIWWCLFAFITTGFEHSIANMSLLTVALLAPNGATVTLAGYFYNILVVTAGNIIGGVALIALPYAQISSDRG